MGTSIQQIRHAPEDQSRPDANETAEPGCNQNERPTTATERPPYEAWSLDTLYDQARQQGIRGRYDMGKEELIAALRRNA